MQEISLPTTKKPTILWRSPLPPFSLTQHNGKENELEISENTEWPKQASICLLQTFEHCFALCSRLPQTKHGFFRLAAVQFATEWPSSPQLKQAPQPLSGGSKYLGPRWENGNHRDTKLSLHMELYFQNCHFWEQIFELTRSFRNTMLSVISTAFGSTVSSSFSFSLETIT